MYCCFFFPQVDWWLFYYSLIHFISIIISYIHKHRKYHFGYDLSWWLFWIWIYILSIIPNIKFTEFQYQLHFLRYYTSLYFSCPLRYVKVIFWFFFTIMCGSRFISLQWNFKIKIGIFDFIFSEKYQIDADALKDHWSIQTSSFCGISKYMCCDLAGSLGSGEHWLWSQKKECVSFVFYCFENLLIAITLEPLVRYRWGFQQNVPLLMRTWIK